MNRLGTLFVATALFGAACKDGSDAERAAENLQDQREELAEETRELKEAVHEQGEDQRELLESQVDRSSDRVAGLPGRSTGRLNEEEIEHNANEIADESEDIADQAKDVKSAALEFQQQRAERTAALRSLHQVIGAQPNMIQTFAGMMPFTDRAQAELNDRMQTFQMRLDEAGNAIEALDGAEAASFDERDAAARDAIDQLEEARDAAWEALNDGDRIEPS